ISSPGPTPSESHLARTILSASNIRATMLEGPGSNRWLPVSISRNASCLLSKMIAVPLGSRRTGGSDGPDEQAPTPSASNSIDLVDIVILLRLNATRGGMRVRWFSLASRPWSLTIGDQCLNALLSGTTSRGFSSPRSEEHTSELQSREKLVCRL